MTNLKILGISGSPRKDKNTHVLLKAALEMASEMDAKTELLSLADVKILPCTGCNTCSREKRCSLDGEDDMLMLKEKLQIADGVILAAPSYFGGVPGVMKNIMDRSRALKMDDHRLKNKVTSAISLSGLRYGGAEHVTEQLIRFGLMHGMIIVGGVGNPLLNGYFSIASLQSDEGWRRAGEDKIAIDNARGVGKRVVEIARELKTT